MIEGQRTHEGYWTARWQREAAAPLPIDVEDRRLDNAVALQWHRYFRSILADVRPGMRLLEIGCAQSRWLPYFHRQFGLAVSGLDYSALGCAKAQAVLDAAGVEGEIVCADLFEPPSRLLGQFDVVISFGVVEHFNDTAACVAACARLAKPGGLVVTTIPNMRGSIGWLQRRLDHDVYVTHVPLRPRELAAAHVGVGLDVLQCDYLMPANWGVVATDQHRRPRSERWIRAALKGASKLVWLMERRGVRLPPNPLTSPYIACAARTTLPVG
jgi:2-polyprenyl-3-methyl-5-hydroxy-6-metoxy-1,4-benzoquinol methylase